MNLLAIGYIALCITMLLIIVTSYYNSLIKLKSSNAIRKASFVLLGILAWWAYTYLVSLSDFLKDFSLPPRFPILFILPVFIFTGIILYKNRNSPVIHAIPLKSAIFYQSFRILIESLFVASVTAGILHKEVTIEGYNYDMIFGYTAPIIGLLVFSFKVLPKRALLYWNYIGLFVIAIIISLFVTTMYFPQLWGNAEFTFIGFLKFPYVLVASFLMPSAVFVHILSIIQLKKYLH